MESIWRKTCQIEGRPQLAENISADVAVIGGGMAGLLIAWQLQQAGQKTVVLEAGRIAGGQTQNTTAKITAQHGMLCDALLKAKGKEKAKKYFQANQRALEEYRRIILQEGIPCDFQETASYVYSQNLEKLQAEEKAAKKLDIAAELVEQVPLPVPHAGAVRFAGQAQFHPLKFVKALSSWLTIYEHTPVKKVERDRVVTPGGTVAAPKIIFASHYPFINFPGLYFARMHQQRSYVLALEGTVPLEGMYIGEGRNAYSFRQYGKYLLLGGGGHRTGEEVPGGGLEGLRKAAGQFFPNSREAACWAAQDCMPADRIPYIGRYSSGEPNWFVATGFQKWGMTSAMAASMILRDMICGLGNPYEEIFSPERFSAGELPQILRDGAEAVKGLAKRAFQLPEKSIRELGTECGQLVEFEGKRRGAYRKETGELFLVNPRCPHMGCQLAWNSQEKTWDCPCHGSRFDYRGNLLDGPAQEGIGCEK